MKCQKFLKVYFEQRNKLVYITKWKNLFYILNCLLIIFNIHLVNAYPDGAPENACSSLLPRHNADVQRYFPSPYVITANQLSSHNGREFNVSISGKTDSFKGFILQARDYHDPENLIVDGVFTPNLFTKVIKCKSNLPNTLTHNSNSDKYYTSVIWKPSDNFKDGKLVFRGTVVLNAKTFWSIDSNPVEVKNLDYNNHKKYLSNSIRLEAKTEKLINPDYLSCKNKIHFCVGLPNNCIESEDCSVLFKSYSTSVVFTFEIIGFDKTSKLNSFDNKYIAAGLSDDQQMGDDLVFACIKVKGDSRVKPELSYNEKDYSNSPLAYDALSFFYDVKGGINDGKLTCKWEIRYDFLVNNRHYNLLNDYYYILLAKGDLNENTDTKQQHDSVSVSETKVQLRSVGIVSSKRKIKTLVKLHGSFMVLAWIYLSSLAIITARYYKDCWDEKKILGVKVWFFIHRTLNTFTIISGVIATVSIFVNVGGWRANSYHQYFGLVTNILMISQPLNSLFRCDPQDKSRWIFNLVHWVSGNTAHVCGIIAILLASTLSGANLPNYFNAIVIVFIIFHCLIHIVLQSYSYHLEKKVQKEEIPMRDINMPRSGIIKDNNGESIKKFILSLYFVVLTAITIALLIIICRNP